MAGSHHANVWKALKAHVAKKTSITVRKIPASMVVFVLMVQIGTDANVSLDLLELIVSLT